LPHSSLFFHPSPRSIVISLITSDTFDKNIPERNRHVCLLAWAALAQDASTGALRGTVTDATGSRIGDATIVLVNDATDRVSAERDKKRRSPEM